LKAKIYQFVQCLLGDKEIRQQLLSSELFLPVFVSFGCEPKWRSEVMRICRKRLFKNARLAEISIPIIFSLLKSGTSDEVSFSFQLLKLANKLFAKYPQQTEFAYLEVFVGLLKELETHEQSGGLIGQIVRSFRVTKWDKVSDVFEIMADTFLRLKLSELPTEIFSDLVFLLAENTRSITRLEVSNVLVAATWFSRDSLSGVREILALCEHSGRNCYLCHAAKLEIRLLKLLNARKTEEECEELVDLSLQLIFRIMSLVSSTSVVYAFVSVLCATGEEWKMLHKVKLHNVYN